MIEPEIFGLMIILREFYAEKTGLIEAFLESAPQFILQCSIILRTGNISKYFCFSIRFKH